MKKHVVIPALVIAASHVLPLVISVPISVQMLIVAPAIVYLGSHLSLAVPGTAEDEKDPALSQQDALTFPFTAAGTLGFLYVFIKYVSKDYTNYLISVYFGVFGALAIGALLGTLVRAVAGRSLDGSQETALWQPTVPYFGFRLTIRWIDIITFSLGVALAASERYVGLRTYILGGEAPSYFWLLNNIVGLSLCLEAIPMVSVGTFKTGSLLMVALFVYDVVMVFGTGMMQEVALSLDVPIKLLFPNPAHSPGSGTRPYSLLGLGDIVLPGFFMAFLLRFDATNATVWAPASFSETKEMWKRRPDTWFTPGAPGGIATSFSFEKPFFIVQMVAYALSLISTTVVMLIWNHAQPALLYIVPALLLAALGTAMGLAQWMTLTSYSESSPEEDHAAKAPAEPTESDEEPPTDPAPVAGSPPASGTDAGVRRRRRRLE